LKLSRLVVEVWGAFLCAARAMMKAYESSFRLNSSAA
jgi:hypothetical protein